MSSRPPTPRRRRFRPARILVCLGLFASACGSGAGAGPGSSARLTFSADPSAATPAVNLTQWNWNRQL
ncbi:MAG: hypothetical protein ACXVCV_18615, partial [Polyangia bacterium]